MAFRSSINVRDVLLGIIMAFVIVMLVKSVTGSFSLKYYGNSDMDFYLPIQYKLIDSSLYSRDPYVSEGLARYPNLVNFGISKLISFIGNAATTYALINLVLFVIFWLGNYILCYYLSKNNVISLIYAFTNSFGYSVLFGTYWGIIIGIVSLRDFFTALVPWLLLLYFMSKKDKQKSWFFLFLGICTLLHIIYGLTLFLIIILTYFISEKFSINLIFRTSKYLLFFLIGVAPLLITMSSTIIGGSINEEILKIRMSGHYSIDILRLLIVFFIPGLSYIICNKYNLCNIKNKIKIDLMVATIIVFTVIFFFCSLLIPSFSIYEFTRINKYLIPFLLFYVSYLIYYSIFINRKLIFFGLVLFTISIIPFHTILYNFIDQSTLNFKLDFREERYIREETKFNTMFRNYASKELDEIVQWTRKNTNKDSLFLVTPHLFASRFRAHTQRSVFVSFKDGGMVILKSNISNIWYSDMKRATNLYVTNSTTDFIEFAKEKQSEYIVVEKKYNQLDLPIVFINSDFIVYDIQEYLN
jgi:hypothetical protein